MNLFNVYTKQTTVSVYRVFDPVAGRYCQSVYGHTGGALSVWVTLSEATRVLNHLPEEVRSRAVIREFGVE